MDCLPKKIAVVERWPLVEVHCGFSHSCSYYSLGATPRSVSVLRSVQTKEKVVHAFLQRIK